MRDLLQIEHLIWGNIFNLLQNFFTHFLYNKSTRVLVIFFVNIFVNIFENTEG